MITLLVILFMIKLMISDHKIGLFPGSINLDRRKSDYEYLPQSVTIRMATQSSKQFYLNKT